MSFGNQALWSLIIQHRRFMSILLVLLSSLCKTVQISHPKSATVQDGLRTAIGGCDMLPDMPRLPQNHLLSVLFRYKKLNWSASNLVDFYSSILYCYLYQCIVIWKCYIGRHSSSSIKYFTSPRIRDKAWDPIPSP